LEVIISSSSGSWGNKVRYSLYASYVMPKNFWGSGECRGAKPRAAMLHPFPNPDNILKNVFKYFVNLFYV